MKNQPEPKHRSKVNREITREALVSREKPRISSKYEAWGLKQLGISSRLEQHAILGSAIESAMSSGTVP